MEDLSNLYLANKYSQKKKDVGYHVGKWFVFGIFVIYAVTLLFPFVFMIINSFKSGAEFDNNVFGDHNVFAWPKEFYGKNFIEVLKTEIDGQSIANMFLMSVLVTVLGTILNVGLSTIAAYCLAKFKFPGRNVIYAVAIFTMIVPIVGTLPAQVQMMDILHLSGDNGLIGVLFLYSGCFGFNFILLYGAFTTISDSYMEAASIDGAGRFKTFFKVMVPQAKGSIIACSVLQALALWNDYSTPYLFLPRGHTTLAVGLNAIQTESQGNYPMMFASMLIAIVPVLILYLCFQKKIIESTNAGGLKGWENYIY